MKQLAKVIAIAVLVIACSLATVWISAGIVNSYKAIKSEVEQ